MEKVWEERAEESMMKKNLIIRKRYLLYMTIFVMLLGLNGCGTQLTVDTYVHEAGETLPTDVSAYAELKDSDQARSAVVELDRVDPDKVGTYDAAIVLADKEYPFTVKVVDTKAPEGTFQQLVVACGIAQTVTPEWFECSGTDASEFQYGIRSAELIQTEEELKTTIQKNIKEAEAAGVEQLMLRDLAGVTWNDETDTWDESGVSADGLESEFVPEKEGLWRLEMLSVDEYGNANVFYCYVIADLEAPEYDMESEVEITSPTQFDIEDYMKRLQEKMKAKDNLLGDVSDKIEINEVDFVKEYDDYNEVKVSSSITDMAGNITKAEHIFKVYNAEQAASNIMVTSSSLEQEALNSGYDRKKAEQAFALVNQQRVVVGLKELAWEESLYDFACTRSMQITSDFSHNLPNGTDVSHYLLNNVGGASGYGENIAQNYKNIDNLVNAWMNSQGHKDNILDSRYTAGVMACYYYNGGYYWVNLFKAQ